MSLPYKGEFMSLVNTTIWATVSMSTIQATPIWQSETQKYNGVIPSSKYNAIIKSALVTLGMNEEGHYTVENNVNIRSNNNLRVVYANTTLFTFPVNPSCKFKRIYQNRDILHFGDEDFTGWNTSHIKMEDFGNEHDPSRSDSSDF